MSLFAQDKDTMLIHVLRIENDTECVNQLYTNGFELVDKNPQLAYEFALYCQKKAQNSGSKKHIAKSDNLLGMLFQNHGHYKKAVVYFEKYLDYASAKHDTLSMAYGYTNLGNAYLRLEQFDKVERFFLKSINFHHSLGNKKELANGLINLGALKQWQKQLDAAVQNYMRAFEIGKELYDYEIKAICLNNMAQVFLDKGNYDKALALNFDALELRDLMELDADKADSYFSIAEVALKQKNVALAEENLVSGLKLCTKIGYLQGKINYYKLFSELQALNNNHQLANENLKIYVQLNDSVLATEGDKIEFDFEGVVEQNYQATQTTLKNTWLLALLSVILISVAFVLIRYKR